jgi:hypothetical protein
VITLAILQEYEHRLLLIAFSFSNLPRILDLNLVAKVDFFISGNISAKFCQKFGTKLSQQFVGLSLVDISVVL